MNCEDIRPLLDLYAEGELAEAQREHAHERVREHLSCCASCQRSLSNLRQMDELLRTLGHAETPGDLVDRIMQSVKARTAPGVSRPLGRTVAVGFGLSMALVLLLWIGYNTALGMREEGIFEFLSLATTYSETVSIYFSEWAFAVLESLPVTGIVLSLGATLVVCLLLTDFLSLVRQCLQREYNGSH